MTSNCYTGLLVLALQPADLNSKKPTYKVRIQPKLFSAPRLFMLLSHFADLSAKNCRILKSVSEAPTSRKPSYFPSHDPLLPLEASAVPIPLFFKGVENFSHTERVCENEGEIGAWRKEKK